MMRLWYSKINEHEFSMSWGENEKGEGWYEVEREPGIDEYVEIIENPNYGKPLDDFGSDTEESTRKIDERKHIAVIRKRELSQEEIEARVRSEQRAQIAALYDYDTELKILREEIAALRAGKPQTEAFAEMNERIRGIIGGDDSTTTEAER